MRKRMGWAAAVVILSLATPSSARAEEGACATAASTGAKIWEKAGPLVKSALATAGPTGATAAQVARYVERGIELWNLIVGDESWAKIGPRRLDFEKSFDEGTLIGPSERLFLTGVPATNPVTVDFNKVDFDGEASVTVCKVPEKGPAIHVTTFTVDKATKVGNVRSIAIADAKGYVISVALHGKSLAKKLKYKVRAKNTSFRPEVDDTVVTGQR
jgi:hypothetical protein